MKIEDRLKTELKELTERSVIILDAFQGSVKGNKSEFIKIYQSWFTQAFRIVKVLAPERLVEFSGYYNSQSVDIPESKYTQKEVRYKDETTYTIMDYILGVEAKRYTGYMGGDLWNPVSVVSIKLNNQLEIINAINQNVDKALFNLGFELLIDLQERELFLAGKLSDINPRAAGAMACVVLKNHLDRVIEFRKIKFADNDYSMIDIVERLKDEGVIDSMIRRKILYLKDLCNVCEQISEKEPGVDEVNGLISGVKYVVKTIF